MNKSEILKVILEEMQSTLDVQMRSAHEAKEAATNEESKAENKYDTRGLEASYLAGAQALRASEMQKSILMLSKIDVTQLSKTSRVIITSLVNVLVDGEASKWFFLLPFTGGIKVQYKQDEIQTLNPESPLAKKILGLSIEDSFEFKSGNKLTEYEVIKIL